MGQEKRGKEMGVKKKGLEIKGQEEMGVEKGARIPSYRLFFFCMIFFFWTYVDMYLSILYWINHERQELNPDPRRLRKCHIRYRSNQVEVTNFKSKQGRKSQTSYRSLSDSTAPIRHETSPPPFSTSFVATGSKKSIPSKSPRSTERLSWAVKAIAGLSSWSTKSNRG